MSEIQTDYRGELITYRRADNTWHWQGSNRGLISLEAAEASINRALDGKNDEPKFQKRKALFKRSYDKNWHSVEVTSQDGYDFWIVQEEKGRYGKTERRRSKEDGRYLIADTTANQAKIEEWKRLQNEVEKLEEQSSEVEGSLQSFADWLKKEK